MLLGMAMFASWSAVTKVVMTRSMRVRSSSPWTDQHSMARPPTPGCASRCGAVSAESSPESGCEAASGSGAGAGSGASGSASADSSSSAAGGGPGAGARATTSAVAAGGNHHTASPLPAGAGRPTMPSLFTVTTLNCLPNMQSISEKYSYVEGTVLKDSMSCSRTFVTSATAPSTKLTFCMVPPSSTCQRPVSVRTFHGRQSPGWMFWTPISQFSRPRGVWKTSRPAQSP
mmetsp:Transcript_50648/g.151481  ORF Transcript_50648/g.151481 Transcript_50648/m.151481 type:complete len:230 (-) Transcript_50648:972-1661(-)